MTYRIRGLEPQPFAALFELDDAELEARGMTRMIVDNPNFPCRISLSDRELGEEVILLNHVSHDGNNPYRASHAIFVSKAAEAADYAGPRYLPSVKRNVAPSPGRASAQIRPPCRWITRCAVASPIPEPGNSAVRCSRWKGPNSRLA